MKTVEMEELLEINFLKLNLLPKAPIEKFWDAMWLGIRPFFRSIDTSAEDSELRTHDSELRTQN